MNILNNDNVQGLIESYRAGNDSAMINLHKLLKGIINRSCAKALASNKAAHLLTATYENVVPDLEAEVWEEVLIKLKSNEEYPFSEVPIPYIRNIAKNMTIDFARRINSKQTNQGTTSLNDFESYDLNLGEEPRSESSEPVSIDDAENKSSIIKSLLDKLNDKERQVYLQTVEGYTQKEISEKLEMSLRSVKNHRKAIINKLGDYVQREDLSLF